MAGREESNPRDMTTREKPTVAAVLHSSTLLNALDAGEMERLIAASRVVRAERGEVIWHSGAEAEFFGLVSHGFVKMVRSCADGSDTTIELMGPAQIFGLMGTITGSGCPLSAVAVTDLWYARILKSVFLEIFEKSMPMKDRLLRRTAVRLHGMVDLMARMSSGKVEERIAAILFVLSESYGVREKEGLRLEVPLTRQEISEMAGTTVESTIRTMSRWQKEGLISTDRQFITIQDERGLSAVLAGIK